MIILILFYFVLFLTVSSVSEKSLKTVNSMLNELEKDNSVGRYVIWLSFSVPQERLCGKSVIAEFLQGECFGRDTLCGTVNEYQTYVRVVIQVAE